MKSNDLKLLGISGSLRLKTIIRIVLLIGLFFLTTNESYFSNNDSSEAGSRRCQVINLSQPFSFIVQMTMNRGKKYNGTAFFIHPRVLLTAGHNLRKRTQFIYPRVKGLTLRFGATNSSTNLFQLDLATTQNDNIYTLQSFNEKYSIYEDYGIIILPDEAAYKKVGGTFKLSVFDSTIVKNNVIHLSGYPGDQPFCTQWQDSTKKFFFYKSYMHYDFATEHGASGAPIWYSDGGEFKVFAIHTNGDGFDQFPFNTATLITKEIYDDIVRFCSIKGIDITK